MRGLRVVSRLETLAETARKAAPSGESASRGTGPAPVARRSRLPAKSASGWPAAARTAVARAAPGAVFVFGMHDGRTVYGEIADCGDDESVRIKAFGVPDVLVLRIDDIRIAAPVALKWDEYQSAKRHQAAGRFTTIALRADAPVDQE